MLHFALFPQSGRHYVLPDTLKKELCNSPVKHLQQSKMPTGYGLEARRGVAHPRCQIMES